MNYTNRSLFFVFLIPHLAFATRQALNVEDKAGVEALLKYFFESVSCVIDLRAQCPFTPL